MNHYKKLFLSIVLICTFAPAMEQQTRLTLFTNDGIPTAALSELLAVCKIDGRTKAEIVKATQEQWIRPADKERYELVDTPEQIAMQPILMPIFEKIGLIKQVSPLKKEYDYILVMGAYYKRAKLRLEQALRLCDAGYQVKEIVLLGSERPLNPAEEPTEIFGTDNPPKTEHEMMKWIDSHASMADATRRIKRTYVNAPNTTDADGKIKRANTADTFKEWLKTNPKPGSCLVVSNQPYVGYQAAVARLYLPSSFAIDATGQETNHDQKGIISIILDSLARWIYQEKLMLPAS